MSWLDESEVVPTPDRKHRALQARQNAAFATEEAKTLLQNQPDWRDAAQSVARGSLDALSLGASDEAAALAQKVADATSGVDPSFLAAENLPARAYDEQRQKSVDSQAASPGGYLAGNVLGGAALGSMLSPLLGGLSPGRLLAANAGLGAATGVMSGDTPQERMLGGAVGGAVGVIPGVAQALIPKVGAMSASSALRSPMSTAESAAYEAAASVADASSRAARAGARLAAPAVARLPEAAGAAIGGSAAGPAGAAAGALVGKASFGGTTDGMAARLRAYGSPPPPPPTLMPDWLMTAGDMPVTAPLSPSRIDIGPRPPPRPSPLAPLLEDVAPVAAAPKPSPLAPLVDEVLAPAVPVELPAPMKPPTKAELHARLRAESKAAARRTVGPLNKEAKYAAEVQRDSFRDAANARKAQVAADEATYQDFAQAVSRERDPLSALTADPSILKRVAVPRAAPQVAPPVDPTERQAIDMLRQWYASGVDPAVTEAFMIRTAHAQGTDDEAVKRILQAARGAQ